MLVVVMPPQGVVAHKPLVLTDDTGVRQLLSVVAQMTLHIVHSCELGFAPEVVAGEGLGARVGGLVGPQIRGTGEDLATSVNVAHVTLDDLDVRGLAGLLGRVRC